jgi:hypothetical protein
LSRFFICILFSLFFSESLSAQSGQDSIPPVKDSLRVIRDTVSRNQPGTNLSEIDSVSKRPENPENWHIAIGKDFFTRDVTREILKRHPYFGITAPVITIKSYQKEFNGKEFLFYTLIGLLLAFALLKRLFPKYFNDLFRLFFRTTLKQRQIREQLMQSPLPSLLFNGFFIVSSALYVDLLVQHFKLISSNNFWEMFLYSAIAISGIYLIKFLGLKLSGWIFSAEEATNSYVFIVFIVNKMIGIYLLPFLVLLAFTQENIYQVSLMLSWCGIAALYLYRLILSYGAIRNQVKLNPFHFLLYICAFEVAPVMLLYKALLFFFNRTT